MWVAAACVINFVTRRPMTLRGPEALLPMTDPPKHDVTELLVAWGNGDEAALEQLVPLVHAELHRLARRYMGRERAGHTLETIIEGTTPWGEQTPLRIGRPADPRLGIFWAFSWSPDGRRLAGWSAELNQNARIVTYDFVTRDFKRITDFGSNPVWLKDGRRLLFSHRERLYLVNVETRKTRELSVPLPPSSRLDGYGLSPDNRLLYYGLASKEADVWLLDID